MLSLIGVKRESEIKDAFKEALTISWPEVPNGLWANVKAKPKLRRIVIASLLDDWLLRANVRPTIFSDGDGFQIRFQHGSSSNTGTTASTALGRGSVFQYLPLF